MKSFLKITATIFFSLFSIVVVLWLLSLATETRLSASSLQHNLSQTEPVTHSIYLPYVAKQDDGISSSLEYGTQVDPNNYTSNITHVQTLGFKWVRFQMPWKYVEPAHGDLHWDSWDERINAYHQANVKILLTIGKAPDWARPVDDDKAVEGLPDDPQTYVDFVISVTNRYSGQVQAIEVWEDQNLFHQVGGLGRVDVPTYMSLLTQTYTAFKTHNPDVIVISGGLAAAGAFDPYGMDDREYLQQMYTLGLKDFSDAIGAKPYGFLNPPDSQWPEGDLPGQGYDDHRCFYFRNTMEDYRQIMVDAGDGNTTVWPTEFGWGFCEPDDTNCIYAFAKENTRKEQANFIQRAYEMGKSWGWVGPMFLWNLDYGVTAPATEFAIFSILTLEGPTPAYNTLRDMPK